MCTGGIPLYPFRAHLFEQEDGFLSLCLDPQFVPFTSPPNLQNTPLYAQPMQILWYQISSPRLQNWLFRSAPLRLHVTITQISTGNHREHRRTVGR